MTWLISPEELSTEQMRAVNADVSRHRLITGAPGSGKTQILLHRAKELRQGFGLEAQFRIFVFTNVLKHYISSALSLLDLPAETVTTFDSWCGDYYREHIGKRLPSAVKGPDFGAIRAAVLAHLLGAKAPRLYDFILVDEGQDLDEVAYKILTLLARHVTVCADHRQQLYDGGVSEATIANNLGIGRANHTLLEAFRCSPYIVDLAACLVADPDRADELRRQARTSSAARETPLLAVCSDFEDEKSQLIEVVRTRALRGDKIAVLLPQGRQVYGFAQGFKAAGIDVQTAPQRGRNGTADLDFDAQAPMLLTYHAAKGLTFDTVCLPRLVTSSFPNWNAAAIRTLLFVGVTRATSWVYLSGISGSLVGAVADLLPIETNGRLTVRRPGAPLFGAGETSAPQNSKTDNDLLDGLI